MRQRVDRVRLWKVWMVLEEVKTVRKRWRNMQIQRVVNRIQLGFKAWYASTRDSRRYTTLFVLDICDVLMNEVSWQLGATVVEVGLLLYQVVVPSPPAG